MTQILALSQNKTCFCKWVNAIGGSGEGHNYLLGDLLCDFSQRILAGSDKKYPEDSRFKSPCSGQPSSSHFMLGGRFSPFRPVLISPHGMSHLSLPNQILNQKNFPNVGDFRNGENNQRSCTQGEAAVLAS